MVWNAVPSFQDVGYHSKTKCTEQTNTPLKDVVWKSSVLALTLVWVHFRNVKAFPTVTFISLLALVITRDYKACGKLPSQNLRL